MAMFFVGAGPQKIDRVNPFDYYKAPEGEDFSTKLLSVNGYALMTAVPWSAMEALYYSKPKGFANIVGRLAYTSAPVFGMATAFATGTFFSCNLRHKDDIWNYAIGGACAGSIFGAWRSSVSAGVVAGFGLGVFGIIKKLSKEEGWEFMPDLVDRRLGSVRWARHDFTLSREREKNWTSDPNQV